MMNRTFARLLDVAYANGGGLAQVRRRRALALLHGRGPRGAGLRRGLRDARRRCARSGGRRPRSGPVTLKMHVGIHSGTLRLLPRRQLAPRADADRARASTRTVEMEAARRGRRDPRQRRDRRDAARAALFGDAKEGGRLLKAPPGRGRRARAAAAARRARPRALRAAADPRATSRTATPSPSTGRPPSHSSTSAASTSCSPREGPDELAEALDELVSTGQRVADEHGVTFLESDIDARRRQDDPGRRRAADRGRATRSGCFAPLRGDRRRARAPAAPDRRQPRPRLRGRGRRASSGAPTRSSAMTAALAARLMGKAQPGQMLDDAATSSSARARPSTRRSSSRSS